MNTLKDYVTVHLLLIQVGVQEEVVILLMTNLIKYVFQMKKKYLNLSNFKMITGINESKKLRKHVSRKCKCKFHGRKCNSNF